VAKNSRSPGHPPDLEIIAMMYSADPVVPHPAALIQPVVQRDVLNCGRVPFSGTTEFLWQEGHTAHATADEALAGK